ncbi:hypothetical protein [Streptomyces sp. NPDC127108]
MTERRAAGERIRDAESARDELGAVLAEVGAVLPSLWLDPLSLSATI